MQVSIVGCGWLGLPLAIALKESGYNIVTTTRSQQKCKSLSNAGFEAVQFSLGDELTSSGISAVFGSHLLILNIPVGRKNPKTENYLQQMQSLLKHAENSQIEKVIFISTTSVYGDESKICTEQSPTKPSTLSGQINLEVETLVSKHFPNHSTIIRPAGLVGRDRHPINYLAGKTDLNQPDNKVNLIHQDDVISAIKLVIAKELWGQTLHLSAAAHPTRAKYYTWAAKELGLAPPKFIASEDLVLGKEIDATKSLGLLGLTLKYPSPYDMIEN